MFHRIRLPSLLLLAALAPARGAVAQPPSQAAPGWLSRVSLGGEVSASVAPVDDEAFFNYADYEHDALRTARLRLFGEWRIAPALSLVAEVRLDNGVGLDASAWYLRWRPWRTWNLDIQAGRIPPVFGTFGRRAYGRDNPVFGAPLVYQYLTSLRPDALPRQPDDLLRMRGRGWRPSFPLGSSYQGPGVPLVSVSRWDTGIEARWSRPRLEIAGSITRGSPAVPVVEETNSGLQWSGRLAARVSDAVTVGVSAARAPWLDETLQAAVPPPLQSHRGQMVLGLDAEYGRGQWLVRAEWLRSQFEVPMPDASPQTVRLTGSGGFVELRYRPHPHWQLASRTGYVTFSDITGPTLGTRGWDASVRRIETVVDYRLSRHIDLRAGWQHNWRDGGRVRSRGFPVAGLLIWF